MQQLIKIQHWDCWVLSGQLFPPGINLLGEDTGGIKETGSSHSRNFEAAYAI